MTGKRLRIIHVALFVLLFISNSIVAQSYGIGNTTITFYDSNRSRNIETKIYYPSDTPGEDNPVATGTFPVLVFGHGFMISWESYQNFWEELVPEGYVVCFPTTESSLSPNHEDFGTDLKFVSSEMQLKNNDSTSIFFNSLASKTGILGHSMGGGASFLAAENNTSISTLINFAAAETTPSAVSAAVNVTVPTLIFSGDDDCVTPPDQNQDLMYDSLSSNCKTHISIRNGGHCYFANNNILCSLGESSCNPSLNITREEQQQVTFDFLKLWLQYSLYNDQGAFNTFNDSLQSSVRINYKQFCNTTGMIEQVDNSIVKVFPNPVDDILNVEVAGQNPDGLFVLYNNLGKEVFQTTVQSCNSQIDLSRFPEGTYSLVYIKGSSTYSTKIVKSGN